MTDFDLKEFKLQCNQILDHLDNSHPAVVGEHAIEAGEQILGIARQLAGHACDACSGFGYKVYSSTATWRGGIGGQAITRDVCDVCWGTGDKNSKGVDLKTLRNLLHGAQNDICKES